MTSRTRRPLPRYDWPYDLAAPARPPLPTGAENVESKAGGVALLVQGLHKSGGAAVHDTLAVLSWGSANSSK